MTVQLQYGLLYWIQRGNARGTVASPAELHNKERQEAMEYQIDIRPFQPEDQEALAGVIRRTLASMIVSVGRRRPRGWDGSTCASA